MTNLNQVRNNGLKPSYNKSTKTNTYYYRICYVNLKASNVDEVTANSPKEAVKKSVERLCKEKNFTTTRVDIAPVVNGYLPPSVYVETYKNKRSTEVLHKAEYVVYVSTIQRGGFKL